MTSPIPSLALILCTLCTAPLTAQDAPTSEPAPQPTAVATAPANNWPFLIGPGAVELPDLIDRCARQLGQNWLVEQASMGGASEIQLQTQMQIRDAGELMSAATNLLYQKGFVVVCRNATLGTYDVISMQGARRGEIGNFARRVSKEQALAMRETPTPVICAVPLQHIDARLATNSLRPFFAQNSSPSTSLSLGTVGDSRYLILQGLAPQVAAAIDVLSEADREAAADVAERRAMSKQISELEAQLAELRERIAKLETLAGKR